MIGALPAPLSPDWAPTLVDVARELRLVPFDDPRMAQLVAGMAAVYNDDRMSGLRGQAGRPGTPGAPAPREQLAARLAFWFPRDVPKVGGAVRELIAMGRLSSTPELRVLDVGAGLGASHRGLARALADAGRGGVVDVLAVDDDGKALEVAEALARKRPREGGVELRLRTEARSVAAICERPPRGRFDVLLFGQVLSELDLELGEARVDLHAERLAALVRGSLAADGVVIVVEPALRTRARHLMRLRQALVARNIEVLAPCLHAGACPLLAREGDWCHEDLDVDLPDFVAPLARRAGLRWEGLTFSYLVLGARGPCLVDELEARPGAPSPPQRVVSAVLQTKGKREVVVCGPPLRPQAAAEGASAYGARVGRLDRAASPGNAPLEAVRRGDVLTLGPLDDKLRLDAHGVAAPLGLRTRSI